VEVVAAAAVDASDEPTSRRQKNVNKKKTKRGRERERGNDCVNK